MRADARRSATLAWSLLLSACALLLVTPARAQSPQSPRDILLEKHAGKACVLERKDSAVGLGPAGDAFDPDQDPESAPRPPAARYEPSEDAVYRTCGGLGCVDDPDVADPTRGVCAVARKSADCAGAADPTLYGGLCGPAHIPPAPASGSYGRRFMFTAQALVEFGPDLGRTAEIDTAIGALFQHSLTQSKARRLPDGGTEHYDLPAFYLHGETHISKQRFGHELGLVYKPGSAVLTRLGLAAYGIVWGREQFVEGPRYRFGPALHFEFLSNLMLRGAYTPGFASEGPALVLSLEYAANLWDDFKN